MRHRPCCISHAACLSLASAAQLHLPRTVGYANCLCWCLEGAAGPLGTRLTPCWVAGLPLLPLLLLLLLLAGAGSAILVLASQKCPSDVHQRYLSCFRSLALRVRNCRVKAWPHPHQGRKQACGSLQLVANVTGMRWNCPAVAAACCVVLPAYPRHTAAA